MDAAVASTEAVVFTGTIRLDKRPGEGEDADPLVTLRPDQLALGVFDGLGGSGAEVYETTDGRKSGAAIGAAVAARATREVIERAPGRIGVEDLKDELARNLKHSLQMVGGESSALKGRLIRKLPTTVAIVRVEIGDAQASPPTRTCTTFWAGDSRIYVLDHRGLRQLTHDHLVTPNDAMQNLLQDSELSNCARADGDFYLESAEVEIGPCAFLVIAASDGVFGYLPTPMHFENLLLQTIAKCSSFSEWKKTLEQQVAAYTQDDATLAYAAIGWPDFEAMRRALEQRTRDTALTTERIDLASHALQAANAATMAANTVLTSIRQSSWEAYRPSYELAARTERS